MIVYVAGPYSGGDVAVNVRNAMAVGNEVIAAGYTPIVPHLSHFLHMAAPQPYEVWIKMDLELLRRCDCLVRFVGDSAGADGEMELARELCIPIIAQDSEYPDVWHFGHESGRLLSVLNLVKMSGWAKKCVCRVD